MPITQIFCSSSKGDLNVKKSFKEAFFQLIIDEIFQDKTKAQQKTLATGLHAQEEALLERWSATNMVKEDTLQKTVAHRRYKLIVKEKSTSQGSAGKI